MCLHTMIEQERLPGFRRLRVRELPKPVIQSCGARHPTMFKVTCHRFKANMWTDAQLRTEATRLAKVRQHRHPQAAPAKRPSRPRRTR